MGLALCICGTLGKSTLRTYPSFRVPTPPLSSSLPIIVIIAFTASQNRSLRSGPRGRLGPPTCDPACLDSQEKTCGILLPPPCKDCIRNNNIGRSHPQTPPPLPNPCVNSPPSWCPAVSNADAATTMIPCLSITGPNAATADGNPSEPHTAANAIVEGDAEIKCRNPTHAP